MLEIRGYATWEESCLVKFSELLGFSTVGNEEKIISLLLKLNDNCDHDGNRGRLGFSKRECELKKLECTINYNG